MRDLSVWNVTPGRLKGIKVNVWKTDSDVERNDKNKNYRDFYKDVI